MGMIITEESLIIGSESSDAMERNKKEEEYLEYIKEHIKNVIDCYNNYMIPLLDETNISSEVSDEDIKDAIKDLGEIIETHDTSKFTDAEFGGYRAKYYPTYQEQIQDNDYKRKIDDWYQECWEHHYKTNDHHPMYWVNEELLEPVDMSLRAIIEMLCDWEAVSLYQGTSTVDWYKNYAEDEKKAMSLNTKAIVEDLLFNVLHK